MDTIAKPTPDSISEMVADTRAGDQLYWPSPFWEQLIEDQTQHLEKAGLSRFKRTLNLQYFSWNMKWVLVFLFWPMLWNWIKHPDLSLFSGSSNLHASSQRFKGLVHRIENRILGVYILLLRHFVRRTDPRGLLDRLDEPSLGDPIVVSHQGRLVSQDLSNSVHEFYSATSALDLTKPLEVVELGGGYGRVGFAFLKALDSCKYTLVDIPPALYIAQEYMAEVFPEEKVFRFRPFSSYDEISEEFESARIRLIAAHQVEMLPDKSANLFINISSLHEMTMPQIQHYLTQADRLTSEFVYSKQWMNSRAPGNGFRIKEEEYPIPGGWSTVFSGRHPIQPRFFHALYQV